VKNHNLNKKDKWWERKQKAEVIFSRIAMEPEPKDRSPGSTPGCGRLGCTGCGSTGFSWPGSEQSSSSCCCCFLPAAAVRSLRGTVSTAALLASCQHWAMPSPVEDEGDVRRGHKINTESIIRR